MAFSSMVEVTFEIGGRVLSPDRIEDELERAIVAHLADTIGRRLRDIRDPKTGARPSVRVTGPDLANIKYVVVADSEELAQRAKIALID